jgi:hypothetical protein
MKLANEFLAPVPAAFYPSGVSVGGGWIFEGKKAAYNRRRYEAAPRSYTLLNVTRKVLGNGELRRVRLRRAGAAESRAPGKECVWTDYGGRKGGLLGATRGFFPGGLIETHRRIVDLGTLSRQGPETPYK